MTIELPLASAFAAAAVALAAAAVIFFLALRHNKGRALRRVEAGPGRFRADFSDESGSWHDFELRAIALEQVETRRALARLEDQNQQRALRAVELECAVRRLQARVTAAGEADHADALRKEWPELWSTLDDLFTTLDRPSERPGL